MPRLPEAEFAVIDERKIIDYLLANIHPAGRGKAAFFRGFGFEPAAWQLLRDALLQQARGARNVRIIETEFGQKYILEAPLPTPSGRRPRVRTVWFVRKGETRPRFVTAYAARGADR